MTRIALLIALLRRTMRVAALAAMALLPAVAAPAQDFTPDQRDEIVRILRDALKTDPTILRDAVETLQADRADQQAQHVRQTIADRHAQIFDSSSPSAGPADAAVTVVEFFDTRCPYCRQVDPMLTSWLDHGPGLRIIFKDMPILGPASTLGSRALLAADRQGGYLLLRTAIMRSPPDLTEDSLRDLAINLGLDWPRLQKDMADPAIQQRLDANISLGRALGVDGTPAFVVGDRLVVGSNMADLQSAISAARHH